MRRRDFIKAISAVATAWPLPGAHLLTAKALGLAVPLTMQMTADEVIE
jgi:hypothetical protein